jgi:hypothetical protein
VSVIDYPIEAVPADIRELGPFVQHTITVAGQTHLIVAPKVREGESNRTYCERLPPKHRLHHETRGALLLLPYSGLVVVPFQHVGHGWNVVTVAGPSGTEDGGYNHYVGEQEIDVAQELIVRVLP